MRPAPGEGLCGGAAPAHCAWVAPRLGCGSRARTDLGRVVRMARGRRFSVGMPERDRPTRGRRLLLAALLLIAVIAVARLMLWVARVPTETVPEERVIRVR